MRQGPKGFSAFEILISLAIVILLLSILIPNYIRMRGNNAVKASVKIVASHLKLAKDVAGATGSAEVNLIASGSSLIRIIDGKGKLVAQDVLPFGVGFSTSWGNNNVTFSQNGTANLGGASTGTVTLTHPAASISRQVQVVQFTGAVIEI